MKLPCRRRDAKRAARWDKAWTVVAKIDAAIGINLGLEIRGLGELDVKLAAAERRVFAASQNDPANPKTQAMLAEHLTLSRLWVLGVYEVVRTMDQIARDGGIYTLPVPIATASINALKKKLEQLRIPLAKYGKPRRSRKDDQAGTVIPVPLIDPQLGTMWDVTPVGASPNVVISRRELSDTLLATLENL